MSKLQSIIKKASQDYYTDGSSEYSDEEFDAMLEQLRKDNPNDPLLTEVGHGYSVDKDTTYGTKIDHIYGPAGSLVKCHNAKEYASALGKYFDIVASLKLDGISVVLYYQDGNLTLALTRGDGTTGIDITAKVIKINPSLATTAAEFTGAIRGEIVMSYRQFDELKCLKPDYKNPRNTVAGLINSKTISDELTYCSIVVYNVVGSAAVQRMYTSYTEAMAWLAVNMNTPLVTYQSVEQLDEHNIDSVMSDLKDRWYGTYPADGIVLTYDKINYSEAGLDKVYYSTEACAYKFEAESKVVKVLGVEWNLGKSKNLIPRIHIDECELSGTSVSWVHGDNAKNILDNKIDAGACVKVLKSGEIIPHISEIIHPADLIELPTTCPACGHLLEWNGCHLCCPNEECSDADMKDLIIWTDIIAPTKGLAYLLKTSFFSEMFQNPTVDAVYERGPINQLSESSQRSLFNKMYNELFSNKIDLVQAVKALNIPRFGDVNAIKLAQRPDLIKDLMDGNYSFKPTDIAQIGLANSTSIQSNLKKFKRLKHIENNIDWEPHLQSSYEHEVVITGKLTMKRADFESLLRSKGYDVKSSVNKNTFCLITDDPNSGSSKNVQADKLGVLKISETDFRDRFLN